MNIVIDQDRLAKVSKLYHGAHNEGDDEMCIMEAVAYPTTI